MYVCMYVYTTTLFVVLIPLAHSETGTCLFNELINDDTDVLITIPSLGRLFTHFIKSPISAWTKYFWQEHHRSDAVFFSVHHIKRTFKEYFCVIENKVEKNQ